MNEDYELLTELHVWGELCQCRLDYEDLTDEQINELLIERDWYFTIAWYLMAEFAASPLHKTRKPEK